MIRFNRNFLDPDTPVSCIGGGDLGGKAQGLFFIREALRAELDLPRFKDISIDIPPLVVIRSDVFDQFMQRNHLYEVVNADLPDDRIAHEFQKADLPFEILGDLRAIVNQEHIPLAVRSSSLLEDAMHEPFAGIYATKMIPNNRYDADIRFRQLVEAVKFVYASTFSRNAKNYRKAIGHIDADEKMAVIIQEVAGKRYFDHFYPELSGVGRSYNYYPMKPAKPQDGVVHLALGLGKIIVDGGVSWIYSPAYPKVEPPFGSVSKLLKETQNEFWAVNMGDLVDYDPTQETEYLTLENITTAEKDNALRYLASTYNSLSNRLSIGTGFKGPRVLTFAPLLVLEELPFNELIVSLLAICEEALGAPVEIEFAMTFNPHRFSFLQVRTMVVPIDVVEVSEEELKSENSLISSTTVLGNGIVDDIVDIVYVKPETFGLGHTRKVVPELAEINQKLLDSNRPYLLIALGRLGTTDPWLGIPTNWGQVSGAKVIVEAAQKNVRIELSQGSHFFHNIINLGIKHFSLPFSDQPNIDWGWLESQPVVEDKSFVRHVHLQKPLHVKVDGKNGRGVINKCQG
ncbi:MAG: PEP/pyruvate-binding domain-containing protein [Anaerolineales bacterium]